MKDLSKFLSEKKKDTSKPHTVDKEEGADDKKYLDLMAKYKKLRRDGEDEEAQKVLKRAQKMSKSGDISKKAKVLAAYT